MKWFRHRAVNDDDLELIAQHDPALYLAMKRNQICIVPDKDQSLPDILHLGFEQCLGIFHINATKKMITIQFEYDMDVHTIETALSMIKLGKDADA